MRDRQSCVFVVIAAALGVCLSPCRGSDPCRINLEWTEFFAGPGSMTGQQGVDLAIDSDGNVVVTGDAYLNFFRSGYGTIKYSPEGELLWQDIYQLDPTKSSYARALAIDGEGNIYVTGEGRASADPSGFTTHSVTLKYAPDGTLLWEHVFSLGVSKNTQAVHLAIDHEGHVIVVGVAQLTGVIPAFVVKIDSDGNTVWERQFQPHSWSVLRRVAVDPSGFISSGGFSGSGSLHLLVVRYAPDGTLLWHDITSGFGNIEEVWDVTADDSGNTYALGTLAVPGISFSLHLMKYSPDGVKLWSESLTHTGGTDSARRVAVGPDGNVIVVGTGGVGLVVDSILIGKYTPDGGLLWSFAHKGDLAWARARDMALDQQGNVFVTGHGAPPGSNVSRYITAKVDPGGELCWSHSYAHAPSSGNSTANAIAINEHGDAFVTGGTSHDSQFWYGTLMYAASSVIGDLNGDGSVGVADLLILLAAWGPCDDPENCPADLVGDGAVGVPDLLILLANWG